MPSPFGRTGLLLFLSASLIAFIPAASAREALRTSLLHTEPWGYYAPPSETSPKGQPSVPSGIMVEIADTVSRESGLPLAPRLKAYGRMWREVKAGETDLVFAIRSPERDAYVRYAGHLFDFSAIVIARPGTPLTTYDDLRPLRIGVLSDIHLHQRFDSDTQLRKVEVRDYETMVDMLLAGRLDAVAGNSVSLTYLLHKRRQPLTAWPRMVLQKLEVWAQVSLRSPHLGDSAKIAETVERLRAKGYFETLLTRYAGSAWRVE